MPILFILLLWWCSLKALFQRSTLRFASWWLMIKELSRWFSHPILICKNAPGKVLTSTFISHHWGNFYKISCSLSCWSIVICQKLTLDCALRSKLQTFFVRPSRFLRNSTRGKSIHLAVCYKVVKWCWAGCTPFREGNEAKKFQKFQFESKMFEL